VFATTLVVVAIDSLAYAQFRFWSFQQSQQQQQHPEQQHQRRGKRRRLQDSSSSGSNSVVGAADVHRSLWERIRDLLGLSDEEVQVLIFERHDFVPQEKNVSVATPAPSPGVPTVPTTPPPAGTPPPVTSLPPAGPPIPPVGTPAPTPVGTPAPSPSSPTTAPPTPASSGTFGPTITAPPTTFDTSFPTTTGAPTFGEFPTSSPVPTVTASPSFGLGNFTFEPTAANETESLIPTTEAPTPAGANTTSDVPTLSPAANATQPPTSSNETGDLTLEQFLTEQVTTGGQLQDPSTPQYAALRSMEENFPDLNPNGASDEELVEIAQTYALDVLYFSTNGTSWTMQDGWLGPTPVCGAGGGTPPWFGVVCEGEAIVQTLDLRDNDLNGVLESELGVLLGLRKL